MSSSLSELLFFLEGEEGVGGLLVKASCEWCSQWLKASGKMAYLPGSRNPEVVTVLWIWLLLTMAQDSGRGMLPSREEEEEEGYLRTKAARSVRFRDLLPL